MYSIFVVGMSLANQVNASLDWRCYRYISSGLRLLMSTLNVFLVTSASGVNSTRFTTTRASSFRKPFTPTTTDRHIFIMTVMSFDQGGTPFLIDPALLALDSLLDGAFITRLAIWTVLRLKQCVIDDEN
jgi:hypothetical protein